MDFLIDENIPLASEAFSPLGPCSFFPGQAFKPEQVGPDTYLLIRSVTPIQEKTFTHHLPQWIGSATAGTDHIDFQWIKRWGLPFDFAPGSNANSVAEYVTLALCEHALKRGTSLKGASLGVIGCGEVGSRVIKKAKELGLHILAVDPPLQERTPNKYPFVTLQEAFTADVVTVHVPLTGTGKHPTKYFITDELFDLMPESGLFLNTSRGRVVKEYSLLKAMERGIDLVLDVFENEPYLLGELAENAFILTPHVAGYGVDGKLKGTQMLYDSLLKRKGIRRAWDYRPYLPEKIQQAYGPLKDGDQGGNRFTPTILSDVSSKAGKADKGGLMVEQAVVEASTCTFDLPRDSFNFRSTFRETKGDKERWPEAFYTLRKHYTKRFEWDNIAPHLAPKIKDIDVSSLKQKLLHLGFHI